MVGRSVAALPHWRLKVDSEMRDTDDTRGLTQRELLLEVRQDVKEIRLDYHLQFGRRPTRTELLSALGGISILIAIATSLTS